MRTLPDFTTANQSVNETTRKSNYVSNSAENGPAMAGTAGPVPAPMLSPHAARGYRVKLQCPRYTERRTTDNI